MDYSIEATFYRTALLLGLVRGDVVHGWAARAIEQDPQPPQAIFEVVSVPSDDLSELRYHLWPMVVEPDPPAVLEAMFGLLHADLSSGRRDVKDTITVLRQMRSMLRLPPDIYANLNAALVAHATEGRPIAGWLARFADAGLARPLPGKPRLIS